MIKHTRLLTSLTLGTLLSATAHSDVVGVYLGGGIWQSSFSGEVGIDEQPASLEELGIDDSQNTYFFAALEHPVPVLPNVRLVLNNISTEGSAVVSRDIIIDDIVIPANAETDSELDLSHTDYTFYWELLDNYVSWDLGLTARAFDGRASISYFREADDEIPEDLEDAQEEELAETIPMAYTRLQVDLPFSGWFIGGTVNYVGYDGNTVSDLEARIGYLSSGLGLDVGFDLGYRQLQMTVDNDEDMYADLKTDGAFASLIVHF